MPPDRDWPLRVRDILGAVDRIARYTWLTATRDVPALRPVLQALLQP